MEEMTLEEYKKAYSNMQNIIDDQEKKIKKLKQKNKKQKDNFHKQFSEQKKTYRDQIEILTGVELENREVVKSKNEHVVLLHSIRLLLECSPSSFREMYSNFERIVIKDIHDNKKHTSLSLKQRDTISVGLEYQKITSIN